MNRLPPPATGTELYLAAIHEELRALRVAFVDGLPGLVAGHVTAALNQVTAQQHPSPAVEAAAQPAPTKRTRTRTRGADDDRP